MSSSGKDMSAEMVVAHKMHHGLDAEGRSDFQSISASIKG